MKLTRNPKILIGGSVTLTTSAFSFASMLTFDRYPLPIKVVLISGLLVGGTLQIWGTIEQRKLPIPTKEKVANL